jgi:hypothetical protein
MDASRGPAPREGGPASREAGPAPREAGVSAPHAGAAAPEGAADAREGNDRPPQDRGEIRRDWRERTDRPVAAAAAVTTTDAPVAASAPSVDTSAPSAAPTSERPPRSFSGPRDAARDDRGLRGRRHERKGPAPLRNDAAPTEKEFWEVWSEERGQAGASAPPSAESATASADAPRAVPSADGGETPGPVISPPRFRGSDELAPGMARLYLNLGRKDGAAERDVLELLSTHATMSRPPELDIMNTHTYINVPVDDAGRVCEALTGKELAGRALVCEPAKPRRR